MELFTKIVGQGKEELSEFNNSNRFKNTTLEQANFELRLSSLTRENKINKKEKAVTIVILDQPSRMLEKELKPLKCETIIKTK